MRVRRVGAAVLGLATLAGAGWAADTSLKLQFVAVSDTHITTNGLNDLNTRITLEDIAASMPGAHALSIQGDLTDHGYEGEYDVLMNIMGSYPKPPTYYIMGNHDAGRSQAGGYTEALARFKAKTGMPSAYFDRWINGYHFIFLATDVALQDDASFSNTQLDWLRARLAEDVAPWKAIFVFNHQPAVNIVQESTFRSILSQYPQAYFITGHTHAPVSFSTASVYKAANDGAVGYPQGDRTRSEGLYVYVYGDRVVLRGRESRAKRWLTTWTVDMPDAPTTPTPTPPAGGVEITPGASAVTASTNDGNLPGNTVDNSLATRWSGSGDGAWLKLDLGSTRSVGSVKIAWYNGNARVSGFDLQVSNDNASWMNVLTSAQSGGTSTAEEAFDFADVEARWVRYVGHGNSLNAWNSVTEVSVFSGEGTTATPTPALTPPPPPAATPTPTPAPTATMTPPAAPTPTPTPTPAAYVEVTPPGSAVAASTNDGNAPANTVDGSLGTRWSGNGDGAWVQYDLGTTRTVGHVRVGVYQGNVRRNRFEIQVASTLGQWTTVWSGESSGTTTAEQTYEFADVAARWVRYLGHGSSINSWNSVTEVSVFAVP